jgi:ubiquinone/menaquinone biosynthesis C-methylase UbiE
VIGTLKKIIGKKFSLVKMIETGSETAYDLWAESYDAQPGNLMLDMDETICSALLEGLDLAGKQVADIGCGTGRHWPKIFKAKPAQLTGFDVSSGMLDRLQTKFPDADTRQITDNLFADTADATYDVILSTLTVAHIKDLDEALQTWSRILKASGDIIITDFHPDVLASGGKRTFRHRNTRISIQNYVHAIAGIILVLDKHNFYVVHQIEKKIDESVKHYYAAKDALPVYEQFKGASMIYGLHLRRGDDTQ